MFSGDPPAVTWLDCEGQEQKQEACGEANWVASRRPGEEPWCLAQAGTCKKRSGSRRAWKGKPSDGRFSLFADCLPSSD